MALLGAPIVILIVVVFDYPIIESVLWSVYDEDTGGLTFAHYQAFWSSEAYGRIIFRTFEIAAKVTLLTVLVGYPLAYWCTKQTVRVRVIVLGLVVMTFWVSILVRTYAWIVILGSNGLINRALKALGVTEDGVAFLYNETGILIGMTNVLLPFFLLPLYSAMTKVDGRLIQVAETLGAGPIRRFWSVFFPLTVPALVSSSILIFILSMGFYITPAVLGGGRIPLVANMMDLLINRFANWEMAAVVAVVLMTVTMILYVAYQWLRERYR
ncbi:MAG: ABC transporter permease [Alphaproteobacteria bacterium]